VGFFATCLKRPVGVSLLMLALFLSGALAFRFLPVASLPRVEYPTTMATAVAAPLERRIGQIASVTELTSTSLLGLTTIVAQFDLSRPIDAAARDVQAAINAASADLPAGMSRPPTWRKNNPSAAPVLILALTSTALPPGKVYEAAETILAQQLSQVKGVAQVTVNGSEKPAVRVRVNPAALASMGLGLEDVRAALSAANAAGPKGRIDAPDESYVIRVNDQMYKADEYKSVTVATRHGTPIRLDAVASIVDSVEDVRTAGWFNNQRAVLVFVFKEADGNVIETVDRIDALMPTLRAWLPPAIDLSVLTDRTETIRASVREVELALMISMGLIVAMVFVFLRRLWATFAAAVTVPLSIVGTFGAMYLLGYSLDNLSLMALTIATGFIVDDAIVVVEAISRRMGEGEPPLRAANEAARQIGFTVVSISVSLIAALIPLLFMGGIIGRLFREFAVTVALAIAVSAVVSLALIPVVGAHLGRGERGTEKPFLGDRLFRKLLAAYETALLAVLRHRGLTLGVMVATIVATAVLWIEVPKGFFPQQDTGTVVAIAEAPTTVSFQAMSQRVQDLMRVLLKDPAVARVGSFTGQSGGAPNQARLFIALKPLAERKLDMDQVIARLRRATREVQGVALYMVPVQELRVGGRISKAQYQYTLTGSDLGELETWAGRLVENLKRSPELRKRRTADHAGHRSRRGRASAGGATRHRPDPVRCFRAASGVAHLRFHLHLPRRSGGRPGTPGGSLFVVQSVCCRAGRTASSVGECDAGRARRSDQRGCSSGPGAGRNAELLDAPGTSHPAWDGDRRAGHARARRAQQHTGELPGQRARVRGLACKPARAGRGGARRGLHHPRGSLREHNPSDHDPVDSPVRGDWSDSRPLGGGAPLGSDRGSRGHPAHRHRQEERHHDDRLRTRRRARARPLA
jgi:multidrug efflux pump subunit AcrB